MTILTGTKAVRAQSNGGMIRLTISPTGAEGQEQVLEGDALLVAAGRRPNIEGLGLEAAGVQATARGIGVDARLRTNVSHIYACGDVSGGLMFTHVAGYEAGVALSNAVLRLPRKADYRHVPWCTYTDPEVASVGLNEKRAKEDGIDYRLIEERFGDNDRALAEGEPQGKIKVLVNPGGRPIGVQIVGPHAGELIHEWVAVIQGGIKLTTLAGAIHTYPTLAEISKKSAADYVAEKLFSDRVRKLLHLLFRLQGPVHLPPDRED
jgi:pyruvate/2-oxoglutarate dehydrogenase complex dihydrolipoamide dehydrogenase (E3) component